MKEELIASPQIVKITSKGQFTLPIQFRKDLKLDRGTYLLVNKIGEKYILIEKIETSPLEMIKEVFGKEAKRKSISKEDLEETIEKVREQMWEEINEKV